MTTKVKPKRIAVSNSPSVGDVLKYVDEDNFEYGTGGSGSSGGNIIYVSPPIASVTGGDTPVITHNLNVTQASVESGRYNVWVTFTQSTGPSKGRVSNMVYTGTSDTDQSQWDATDPTLGNMNWQANTLKIYMRSSATNVRVIIEDMWTVSAAPGYQSGDNYLILDGTMTGVTPVDVVDTRITDITPYLVFYETEPVGQITRTLTNGQLEIVSDSALDTMDFRVLFRNIGPARQYMKGTETLTGAGPRVVSDPRITATTPAMLFPRTTPVGYLTAQTGTGTLTIASTGDEGIVGVVVDYIITLDTTNYSDGMPYEPTLNDDDMFFRKGAVSGDDEAVKWSDMKTELSVGSILNDAYGVARATDETNGASRQAIYDKIESIDDGLYEGELFVEGGTTYNLATSGAGMITNPTLLPNVRAKVREFEVDRDFLFNIYFELCRNTTASITVYGQIYINGVAVGVERSTTSESYVGFDENISVSAGDLVQLYVKHNSNTSGQGVQYNNFNLRADRVRKMLTSDIHTII